VIPRSFLIILAITVLGYVMASSLNETSRSARAENIPYSDFLAGVKAGSVSSVRMQDGHIVGERVNGAPFKTYAPQDPGLIGDLVEAGVSIDVKPPAQPGLLSRFFFSFLPILLLIGVWIYFMRRQGLGGRGANNVFGFGQSKARRIEGDQVSVRLSDVAGVDEAKEEVGELVDYLRDPGRYQSLGGAIPRGVLMVGPPGTGKTLLARAIAGEAGVPFFTVSGSDFVEMFVGVGASRVRDLFQQAKKNAPCIVFVDEIDAVGRRRGAGLGGGHDEREQTLNQLLVEMDGFEGTEGVIVVAATNRPDVLDPALLRPGRFDRQVVVGLPDVTGRTQILKLHMRKVPVADDVDAQVIARGTPGFSGADLANLVNEAALLSARARSTHVDMAAFERAKDKILMGAERRSMVMSEDDKRRTAYHEAGHVIVGRLMPEHDPVHKVSIIPRGRALGVTLFLPEQDRYSASKRQLESQIASLFGGRLAEELIYGEDGVTTGAQNDIERATRIARDMVTKWGFSQSMGPLSYDEDEGEVFLGRSVTQHKSISDDTAERIDEEVRAVIDRNYAHAREILEGHRDVLDAMAEALVVHETLSSEHIDAIMAGDEPPVAGPGFDPDDDSSPPGKPGAVIHPGPGPRVGPPVAEHFLADAAASNDNGTRT
jgi:cell division protease FtsH